MLPVNVGSELNYQVDTLDKATNEFIFIGNCKVNFNSIIQNEEYESYLCNEEYLFNDSTVNSNSSFRFNNSTIEFVIDTNRLANLVAD